LRLRQARQLGELVTAQQAAARDLTRRVARAQPHEHLSELEHLDPSASHWQPSEQKAQTVVVGVV